ncbi:MAG: M50 family metallopeptidase [Cyanobacteriota bacterium]|nr:M50 family metallopeptidase [Cyanobacteriota bacterium]
MHQLEDSGSEHSSDSKAGLIWLMGAAVVTILLWQLPWGNYILYPFTILATWFHEMGHGLTAILLGGNFQKLEIFPDGSGVAFHSGQLWLGRLGRSLVAAGGPMAPAIAGSILILLSRRPRPARSGLISLGILLLLSALIWVRSSFGLMIVPLLGLGILGIALWTPPWLQVLSVQFLGVQACVSTYHQIGYLFTDQAVIAGQVIHSDSSQIAQNLLLPYWFWGGLMTLASFILLIQSLRFAYQD